MELFATSPERDHQFSSNQNREMFSDPLAGHTKMTAKLVQSLSIVLMKLIKQGTPTGIGQGFKDSIHQANMQLNGCIYRELRKPTPEKGLSS